jgi:hypothetical protein
MPPRSVSRMLAALTDESIVRFMRAALKHTMAARKRFTSVSAGQAHPGSPPLTNAQAALVRDLANSISTTAILSMPVLLGIMAVMPLHEWMDRNWFVLVMALLLDVPLGAFGVSTGCGRSPFLEFKPEPRRSASKVGFTRRQGPEVSA